MQALRIIRKIPEERMDFWVNLRKLKELETERQILPDIKAVTLFGAAHPLCLNWVYTYFFSATKRNHDGSKVIDKEKCCTNATVGDFVICFQMQSDGVTDDRGCGKPSTTRLSCFSQSAAGSGCSLAVDSTTCV